MKTIFLLFLPFFASAQAPTQFTHIPGGTFLMGSPTGEFSRYPDEGPQHWVTVPSFELGRTEVTQEEWVRVMGSNPSYFKTKEFCPESFTRIEDIPVCPRHPVDYISWDRAQAFIAKLHEADRDHSYRLPNETEWEWAARAGTQTAYSFGDDPALLGAHGWFDGNSNDQTQATATKAANAFGLFDMHGNVHEWTSTEFVYYPGSDLPVPQTPFRYTVRGGSFFDLARNLRSAFRYGRTPWEINETLGFRLVRERKTTSP
jgi:formylglycine-generating enzyme required for sulfatase activity